MNEANLLPVLYDLPPVYALLLIFLQMIVEIGQFVFRKAFFMLMGFISAAGKAIFSLLEIRLTFI